MVKMPYIEDVLGDNAQVHAIYKGQISNVNNRSRKFLLFGGAAAGVSLGQPSHAAAEHDGDPFANVQDLEPPYTTLETHRSGESMR